jgi:type II secretory pathway pseudopilin PulG
MTHSRAAGGFTYIGLLIYIALMGVGLALAGQMWHTAAIREKERELLFIGGEFQRALESYARRKTDPANTHPKALADLLEDRNQLPPQRYLRRIYADPFMGTADWGLIRNAQEGIVGIYSLAGGTPIKQAGFPSQFAEFGAAASYSDWKFIAREDPQIATASSTAPPPAGTPEAAPGSPASLPPPAQRKPPPRDCDKIQRSDISICEEQRKRWDEQTVMDCQLSAQARLAACRANETTLPLLYIRRI